MTIPPPTMTLASLLLAAIRRHGKRPAVSCGAMTLSYAELETRSEELACALQLLGVGAGDTVALHLRNCLEYVVADLALLRLGAVKCALNELMAPEEISYCLQHAGVKLLVRHASLPRPGLGEIPVSVTCIVVPDGGTRNPDTELDWGTALERGRRADGIARLATVAEDSVATLSYTGGTTGAPKCVVHQSGRLATNLLAHVVCGDVRSDEVMLLTTPLPHSAGYHMQACLYMGGHVVLDQKFTPERALSLCKTHNVTWTFAVPTMLYRLFDVMQDAGPPPGTLRTVVYGAAPMSEARLRQGLQLFGPVFIQLYGQTECPNYITTLSKDDHLDPALLRSCGRPVPFCDVEIVDAQGAPVEEGQVGEIAAAAPYLFARYHANPEQTGAILVDGRLRTGDLAFRNAAGFLFLVDRAKDMIITGGMNVYSAEVEAAIRLHPDVLDAAVIGVPHPDWGEAVAAAVVSEADMPLREIKTFLSGKLSAYKLPKSVLRLESLPLTPYGKVDKKQLRLLCTDQFVSQLHD